MYVGLAAVPGVDAITLLLFRPEPIGGPCVPTGALPGAGGNR